MITTTNGTTTAMMLEAALEYAQRGFAVLPLHTPIIKNGVVYCSCRDGLDCPEKQKGKHPRYDEKLIPNGVQNATTDESTIRAWWQLWPNANIGIATGLKSGFIVVDADSAAIVNDAHHRGLPLSPLVKTGRGQHAWFKSPGYPVSNGVKREDFDFRGDGGYVVAPPSLHATGKHYEWVVPLDTPLAESPDWVLKLITGPAKADAPADDTPHRGNIALEIAQQALNDRLLADVNFRKLYNDGDCSGYQSQSEADHGLCKDLLRFAIGDTVITDILFRHSGLYRKKWDEKRGNSTYGAITLEKALNELTNDIRNGNATAQKQQAQRWITLDELLAMPDADFLLPYRIVRGETTVLVGLPAAGKSLIAASWVLELITQGHKVAYVATEDKTGLKMRLLAWCKHNNVDMATIAPNLRVWTIDDLDLMNGDAQVFIAQMLDFTPDLIVIDILGDCMFGGNELDAKDMTVAMKNVQKICDALNSAALVVHHTPWDGKREHGSSVLRRKATYTYLLTHDKDNNEQHGNETRVLTCLKARPSATPPKAYYRIHKVDGVEGVVILPLDGFHVDLSLPPMVATVLQAVIDLGGTAGYRAIQDHIGIKDTREFGKALKQAETQGYLAHEQRKPYTITDAGRSVLHSTPGGE